MTIHKIKSEFDLKASFGELFDALNGIVCAGVTRAKKGADTKSDPVAFLGVEAALLSYDMRAKLISRKTEGENAASAMLDFLKGARETLRSNGDIRLCLPKGEKGGKLFDVVEHIDDILEREVLDCPRVAPAFAADGHVQRKFAAAYLPKAQARKEPEPDMEEFSDDAPRPKPKRGGRPRKNPAIGPRDHALA